MSMFHELMMKKKGMPSRYQEVEYIESTGTQYIDTGKPIQSGYNYKITYACSSISGIDTIMFGEKSGETASFYYNQISDRMSVVISGVRTYFQTLEANVKYTADYTSNYTGTKNAPLFCFYNASNLITLFWSGRIYSFTVKNGQQKIQNFIPVYDTETQKYGMWESVQGKFYGNDGTGDFKGSIVGYTVVGSPTITDGVVSGFSGSNYLQLPIINTLPNNVEFGVAFTTNTVKGVRLFGTSGAASIMSSLSISGTSKITFQLANSSKSFSVISSVSYITGQKYYVEGYQKGTILGIKVSTDNINWVTTEIEIDEGFTTTLPSVLYLGINKNSNSYLEGSLDLNYTYIKLDNKLWFNGQPS